MDDATDFGKAAQTTEQWITWERLFIRVRQQLMAVVWPKWNLGIGSSFITARLFFVQKDLAHRNHVGVAVQMSGLFKRTIRVFAHISKVGKMNSARMLAGNLRNIVLGVGSQRSAAKRQPV